MKKPIAPIFPLALAAVISNAVLCGESGMPSDVVRDFYVKYLDYDHMSADKKSRPDISKSKSFDAAIEENAKICQRNATGVCGWGVDGDPYLGGAQEIDPDLNAVNSGLTVMDVEKGYVQVKLNVYPSIGDADDYYQEIMVYKMVLEDGSWVVDDISTDGKSDREAMLEQNAYYLQNPDPDSPAAQASDSRKKLLYIVLLFVSLAGVFLLFRKRRSSN